MSLPTAKGILFGVWLACVAGISYLLVFEERFFTTSGAPIANIKRASNEVTYRSEDDTRWKKIGTGGQPIFDGDRVATGPGSTAVIDFGDGRLANVGQETAVTVSTIRQAKGMTYILSLPKGSIAIEKSKQDAAKKSLAMFPIIIRSGGRDFQIEPGEEKAIVKDDKGVSLVKGRRPQVRKFNQVKREVKLVELPPVILEKVPVVEVAPPPPVVDEVTSELIADVIPSVPSAAPASAPAPPQTPVPAAVAEVPTPPTAQKPTPAPKPSPPKAPKKVMAMVEKKPPKEVPPPEPVVAGTEIQLDGSNLKSKVFTFQSLSSLTGELGSLAWKRPASSPPGWEGVIEVFDGRGSRYIENLTGDKLQIKLEDFSPLLAQVSSEGLPCGDIAFRGGAKLLIKEKPKYSVAGTQIHVRVCSYKDAENKLPLVVGLSSLGTESPSREKLFLQPDKAGVKYQMTVVNASDLRAIIPLMEKSVAISVAPLRAASSSGLFVARGGKVVMELAGPGFTAAEADRILGIIGGDFVFKGPRKALYDATSMSVDQLKEWVRKSASTGNKVFVQKSGVLVPVSKDFLEERREVAVFVKSVASQVLTEKVEVIAYK